MSKQTNQTVHEWMSLFMHRSMRTWGQFAKSAGLSMPQISILMQLHHKGICGMSQISEQFEISNAAASQLAEKLVQGGYIERTEDPNDRRAKVIQLTAQGEALIKKGAAERHRWLDELIKTLSASEKEKVNQALMILTEAAKKLESTE